MPTSQPTVNTSHSLTTQPRLHGDTMDYVLIQSSPHKSSCQKKKKKEKKRKKRNTQMKVVIIKVASSGHINQKFIGTLAHSCGSRPSHSDIT